MPLEKGHYYYQLVKHYGSKRNCSALGKIQLALNTSFQWRAASQKPIAPWWVVNTTDHITCAADALHPTPLQDCCSAVLSLHASCHDAHE